MVEALGHHSEQEAQAPPCTSVTRFPIFTGSPTSCSDHLQCLGFSVEPSSPSLPPPQSKATTLFFSFPSCKACGRPPPAEPRKSFRALSSHSVVISCQVPGCLITWLHPRLPTPSGSPVSVICELAVPLSAATLMAHIPLPGNLEPIGFSLFPSPSPCISCSQSTEVSEQPPVEALTLSSCALA